jgi:hypothetical protein
MSYWENPGCFPRTTQGHLPPQGPARPAVQRPGPCRPDRLPLCSGRLGWRACRVPRRAAARATSPSRAPEAVTRAATAGGGHERRSPPARHHAAGRPTTRHARHGPRDAPYGKATRRAVGGSMMITGPRLASRLPQWRAPASGSPAPAAARCRSYRRPAGNRPPLCRAAARISRAWWPPKIPRSPPSRDQPSRAEESSHAALRSRPLDPHTPTVNRTTPWHG